MEKESRDKYVPVEHGSKLWIFSRFGHVCSCYYLSSKVFFSEMSNTLPPSHWEVLQKPALGSVVTP